MQVNNVEIIELPEEKTFPRRMLVGNAEDGEYRERLVLYKLPGEAIAPYITVVHYKEKEYERGQPYSIGTWKYAKEIPENEVEEMTLEQICEELGREIKIVK